MLETKDDSEKKELSTKRSVISISTFAEKLTKVITAFTTVLLVTSILTGVFVSQIYYMSFGIDYIQLADLEDYIKAALSNMKGVGVTLITIFLLLTIGHRIFKYNDSDNAKYSTLIFFFFSAVTLTFFFLIKGVWQSSTGGNDILDKYFGDSNGRELKLGLEGVWEITYGKNNEELQCLAFISKTGSMMHYWSIDTMKLISIPVNQLVKSIRIVNGMPKVSVSTNTKDINKFGLAAEEKERLIILKERKAWLNHVESSCGIEIKDRLVNERRFKARNRRPP